MTFGSNSFICKILKATSNKNHLNKEILLPFMMKDLNIQRKHFWKRLTQLIARNLIENSRVERAWGSLTNCFNAQLDPTSSPNITETKSEIIELNPIPILRSSVTFKCILKLSTYLIVCTLILPLLLSISCYQSATYRINVYLSCASWR